MKKIISKQNVLCSLADDLTVLEMPVGGRVAADYPAEAYNYIEHRIDMNMYILGFRNDDKFQNGEGREGYNGKNRKNIKCAWATNRNMTGEGIGFGDLIVIDTCKKPHKDSIIACFWDDELVLKRCIKRKDEIELLSLHEDIKPAISGETLSKIGVVTHVIKKFPCRNNSCNNYPEEVSNYLESGMDFNQYIIGKNYPETIFYLWAGGDSMTGDGIARGDLLVVDKLREHYEDSILVFYIDRQFTLKRIRYEGDEAMLVSSNPQMKPIIVKEGNEVKKWGFNI